jgi:ABC-type branched-subunit amino acid transport system ATPase component
MTFQISLPTASGKLQINIDAGSSAVIVGANGGGKTRLAVFIEDQLKLSAHRISAHRALSLNTDVPKISERIALQGLRTGLASEKAQPIHRIGQRWKDHAAITLLNDFDFLVQALFADQANRALKTHQRIRSGGLGPAEPTLLEHLVEIWDRLLPHRRLYLSGDNIEVSIHGSPDHYSASEMSDGERAIFYMIGQTLVGEHSALLIFDEPELHIHRSIMSKLWDELEAARPDCGFLFITHDLEFAAARVAQKFIIREYGPTPYWIIEEVPEDTGFSEEIATLILGSRKPILFIEGNENSLDIAIYRCCYPEWTVIPRGSCENVIHSVVTMRANDDLTRVTCSGIVDADDYQPDDINYLRRLGIAVLPVSEIENIILLPEVSRAILEGEGFGGKDLAGKLDQLESAIFDTLKDPNAVELVVARYCRRRIDRILKKIDFSDAKTVPEISSEYTSKTSSLNIETIADGARIRINTAITEKNLALLLSNYDNKNLMALAASHLKASRLIDFESWLTRVLRNNSKPELTNIIRNLLPKIHAS